MSRASHRLTRAALAGALALFVASLSASAFADVDKKIVRTWKAKCASCHGEDGKGGTEQGKKMSVRDMSTPEFQKDVTDAKAKAAISNGVKQTTKDGKPQEMEAYKDKIKPEDIDGLVAYIRTFKK